jgi:hypothetical protein
MDTTSSRFILAMTGTWVRNSRYTLDFDSEMLAPVINYRREEKVNMLQWIAPEEGDDPMVPAALTSQQSMTALRRYVMANRLFSNLSDAIAVISDMWMQYVPDTCEGNAWLATTRVACIPKFGASRARYSFLIEGEGAILSSRSLDEFYFLGDKIERLSLYATIKAMAAYVGLYSRAVRRQNEEMPTDILLSEEYIIKPETQFSAAVSEALRVGVPRSGVTGAYVYIRGIADGSFSEPIRVPVVPIMDFDGYKLEEVSGSYFTDVSVLPPPGVPFMLLPLPMFGETGPWALKGKVSFKGKKDRYGVACTMYEAYEYAWIARLCGEDVGIRNVETVNGSRFFASNSASFTYCLQMTQEDRLEIIKVNKKEVRENHFINLPNIHTKESDAELEYSLQLMTHYVQRDAGGTQYRVSEYGGHAVPPSAGDLVVDVSAGIKKLRGYIRRDGSGFHEEEATNAAVIPLMVEET